MIRFGIDKVTAKNTIGLFNEQNKEEEKEIEVVFSPAIKKFFDDLHNAIIQRTDVNNLASLDKNELLEKIESFVFKYVVERNMQFSLKEQQFITKELLNDMIGFGPLERLLDDQEVCDIMINGHNKIYIEKNGKLIKTDIEFRSEEHLMQIAQRIANKVNRRVDGTSPLCDARLPDGSRVNIVIPPVSLDGTSVSIRKFSKSKLSFEDMVNTKSASAELVGFLRIASKVRANIIVSGGTGSGKTTLLNALSSMIDKGERIVTCEDAAELRLQQPHVVRLESRPQNLEGKGEITIRDLVKNALRMRPDRIIIGEVRGTECVDMLQAMNTGHDGSMSTVHANSAKECLTRLENMVALAGVGIPSEVIRIQIAGAVNIIVQTARLFDGSRRIIEVAEVLDVKAQEISVQPLFKFMYDTVDDNGMLKGRHVPSRIVPRIIEKAKIRGLDMELLKYMGIA